MEYSNEELISMARQGDLLAKEKLFEQNSKFSHVIAQKYLYTGIEYEDLVSLANLGMVKAYNTFDESKGFKFITYASVCMANTVLTEFRAFSKKFGKEFVSLDDVCFEGSDGSNLTYGDMIADDCPRPDEIVENNDEIACMEEALKHLSNRDREIMELYYIEEKTGHQIAEMLNISQSYVSRIIMQKLKELKKIMETIRLPEPEKKKMGRPRKNPSVNSCIGMLTLCKADADIISEADEISNMIFNLKKKFKETLKRG
jgi:RNA polymerase sporulation-specific sigma factor